MSLPVLYALLAGLGTWFVTALGAACVVVFKRLNLKWLNGMMGFAAGVMIAASFWSLLDPAVASAKEMEFEAPWLAAGSGFLIGALFLYASDKIISRMKSDSNWDAGIRRATMLVSAITLHNIPEGLAVGVAFGALHGGMSSEKLVGAVLVAVGIGLQNFPEGAAVSLPLRREGCSRLKSFMYGQASGIVEPIAAVVGALLTSRVQSLLPFALSFAAGAMILVAVHELIPECQSARENEPYASTFGIIAGFIVMMILDISLSA